MSLLITLWITFMMTIFYYGHKVGFNLWHVAVPILLSGQCLRILRTSRISYICVKCFNRTSDWNCNFLFYVNQVMDSRGTSKNQMSSMFW